MTRFVQPASFLRNGFYVKWVSNWEFVNEKERSAKLFINKLMNAYVYPIQTNEKPFPNWPDENKPVYLARFTGDVFRIIAVKTKKTQWKKI